MTHSPLRLVGLCLLVALLASACSSSGDREPDQAAFCDALTTPLNLGSVARLDVVPAESDADNDNPQALLFLDTNIDQQQTAGIQATIEASADVLDGWTFHDRDASAADLDAFAERDGGFAILRELADVADLPQYFWLEAAPEQHSAFIDLIGGLRAAPGVDDVFTSTDPVDSVDSTVEIPAVTLFNLLVANLLTPMVFVFVEPDADEAGVETMRRELDAGGLTHHWFNQAQAFEEAQQMDARITSNLSAADMPPSFRVELANIEAGEALEDSLTADARAAVFTVVVRLSGAVEPTHDLSRTLLQRPDASTMLGRLTAATDDKLAGDITTLIDHLEVTGAAVGERRVDAFAAASALRDEAVRACGIDPCVCDRNNPIVTLGVEIGLGTPPGQ